MELEQKLASLKEERAREIENFRKQLSSKEDKVAAMNQEVQVETESKELREMNKEKERLLNEIRVLGAKEDELIAALEERNKRVQELQEKMATLEQDSNNIIENLENELASRNEKINILEKERSEEEAKVVAEKLIVEQQTEEVRMAEQRIFELVNKMSSMKENNVEVIDGLMKELAKQEDQVLSLEKAAESLSRNVDGSAKESNDIVTKLEDELSKVKEQKGKEISDLRRGIEHRDKKILSLEEIMAKNEKLLAEMDAHAEELRKKDCEITALSGQVDKLQSNQSEECQSLRKELISRVEQLEQLERSLKDCKVELEAKSTQLMTVKKVQGGRSLTPTKFSQNNLVRQLEKRLQESTAALDKKNSQLISKNNAIAKLESSLKELRADLSIKEQELNELKEMRKSKALEDNKDVAINELNAQLKEQQCDLLNKTKEKEEVEENLKFVEGELQILNYKEKETQEEIRKITKERDEMKDEAQKWMLKVKNYEEVEGNLNKQLVTQAKFVEEHESQIEVRKFVFYVTVLYCFGL